MTSTFTGYDSGLSASFTVSGPDLKRGGPWPRDIKAKVLCPTTADVENLLALLSWNVQVDRATGGETVWVDVGSGEGEGELVVEDLDSWTAVLTEATADAPIADGEQTWVTCAWLLTGEL